MRQAAILAHVVAGFLLAATLAADEKKHAEDEKKAIKRLKNRGTSDAKFFAGQLKQVEIVFVPGS